MSNTSIVRYTIAPCPLGQLLLAAVEQDICALFFANSEQELLEQLSLRFAGHIMKPDEPALEAYRNAVLEQLNNPLHIAQLPLKTQGSAFQQQVWQALRAIPSGQTRSYGELAAQLGTHARAVARACASNPVALLIPCHRVIAASGALNGYRWGVERKAALLQQEAAFY